MSAEVLSSSFALLTPNVLLTLLVGAAICQVIVAIPGLGGHFVLVMLLPFAIAIEPTAAIGLLIGASVVSGTGNSITSILFGVPGSSMGVATIFDGYPMARKGLAARALAAAFTASAVGGVLGAIVLALLIPVVRPVVLSIGQAEFFMLILVALVFIAMIGSGDKLRSLISGAFGFMLAFVGQEPTTAAFRFTFDQLYLWDGIELVPFLIGLFAIAEMFRLMVEKGSISKVAVVTSGGQTKQGILDVFRHWKATLQSSVVGVIVGLIPGLGGESAQFLAYSQVARTSKNSAEFGQGAIEGVIAADAATNSKEGGSLVPTLLLGIPGSSGMAILLLILITIGVQPGRNLMEENLDLLYMMVWMVVIASVFASGLCLLLTKTLARATSVRGPLIIGPVFVISLFGAYATNFAVGDIWVLVAAGYLGYLMTKYDYSRTTLVIGFVLGGMLESNYLIARRLFGWTFLSRPIVVALMVALALTLLVPFVTWLRKERQQRSLTSAESPDSDVVRR
jgi:putative tricarboxylic transport membrane protein